MKASYAPVVDRTNLVEAFDNTYEKFVITDDMLNLAKERVAFPLAVVRKYRAIARDIAVERGLVWPDMSDSRNILEVVDAEREALHSSINTDKYLTYDMLYLMKNIIRFRKVAARLRAGPADHAEIAKWGDIADRIYVDGDWAGRIEYGIVESRLSERYWELSCLIQNGIARHRIIAEEFEKTMENVDVMMYCMSAAGAGGRRENGKGIEIMLMYKYFSSRGGVLR